MALRSIVHNTELLPPPAGQPNLGATCWFNALFQALRSSTILKQLIDRSVVDPPVPLPAMTTSFHTYIQTGSINRFLTDFSVFAKKKQIYIENQNCTHEAYVQFISETGVPAIDAACKMTFNYEATCSCGFVKEWVDYAYYVGITMRWVDATSADLVRHIMARYAEFDWVCEKCGQKIRRRIERLARVNNLIVVTFFQYFNKKAYKFPLGFTLPATDGPGHEFKLVAQIEHSGSPMGGHYWARCLRREGSDTRVWLLNDTSIAPAEFSPSEETYMLVYERVV